MKSRPTEKIHNLPDLADLCRQLQADGCRLTAVRRSVLDILLSHPYPFSAAEIITALARRKLAVNKTTIYRELAFLKTRGLILELQFADAIKRYEIASDRHHHHVICVNCHKVADVDMHSDLAAQEKAIAREQKFRVLSHSLEFYGLCPNCRDE